jgi:putative copper resistance protein D
MDQRTWGPSAVNDLHEGGAVMWIGGAAIMFVMIMAVFFQWSRETRPSVSMGWLESARQVNLADRFAEANPVGGASAQVRDRVASGAVRNANVDEDEDQLAAYNEYLAHINSHESGPARE